MWHFQPDCFRLLLDWGVAADGQDKFGNTPCHYAAEYGLTDMIAHLLKRHVDVNVLVSCVTKHTIIRLMQCDSLYKLGSVMHHSSCLRFCQKVPIYHYSGRCP